MQSRAQQLQCVGQSASARISHPNENIEAALQQAKAEHCVGELWHTAGDRNGK